MNAEEFNEILEETIHLSRATLASKADEYATGKDRLHNFKRSALIRNTSPEDALVGMMVKHLTSIFDMVEIADKNYAKDYIDEKFKDGINYMILLKAVLYEREGIEVRGPTKPPETKAAYCVQPPPKAMPFFAHYPGQPSPHILADCACDKCKLFRGAYLPTHLPKKTVAPAPCDCERCRYDRDPANKLQQKGPSSADTQTKTSDQGAGR